MTKRKNTLAYRTGVRIEQSYAGPLPHPAELSKYNEISPDLVGRIITMAEKEQLHRHGLQNRVLNSANRRAWLGQICGFFVAIAGLGVACYCAKIGEAAAGTVIGTIDLVALVGMFVLQRRRKPLPESSDFERAG